MFKENVSVCDKIRKASLELVPRLSVHKVLKRYQITQIHCLSKLKPNYLILHTAFAKHMLDRIEYSENYLKIICFSDETTFHLSGKVNRHICRIWGRENPRLVIKHERDSPIKLNVWCGLMHNGDHPNSFLMGV